MSLSISQVSFTLSSAEVLWLFLVGWGIALSVPFLGLLTPNTVIFISVVSSTVLAHDVLDVPVTCRWGSPSFLLAEFCCCRWKNRITDCLNVRPTAEPMRKKVISLKHLNYVSTRKQQNTLRLTTIKKIAVKGQISIPTTWLCDHNNLCIGESLYLKTTEKARVLNQESHFKN